MHSTTVIATTTTTIVLVIAYVCAMIKGSFGFGFLYYLQKYLYVYSRQAVVVGLCPGCVVVDRCSGGCSIDDDSKAFDVKLAINSGK